MATLVAGGEADFSLFLKCYFLLGSHGGDIVYFKGMPISRPGRMGEMCCLYTFIVDDQ